LPPKGNNTLPTSSSSVSFLSNICLSICIVAMMGRVMMETFLF
jgi:hypothetical protein